MDRGDRIWQNHGSHSVRHREVYMTSRLWKGQAFSVSHADGTGTVPGGFSGGLRAFFKYRNLGVSSAQKAAMGQMSSAQCLVDTPSPRGMYII